MLALARAAKMLVDARAFDAARPALAELVALLEDAAPDVGDVVDLGAERARRRS